ncbi:hypothetical protein F544_6850 [Bibersteinia trehalosi USDA-ARS-USMARC-190]|uniref:Uncharacterized protein n=1 Tax=Bibersteinia trehalosi USDA-ARS-USMARC-190 TaxID=1263832 RepID=W0R581_BIBTR|nr:hypothetical protein F544_6850 [Bibersteinia trehalosi USDA-ARS-USMARC-190]
MIKIASGLFAKFFTKLTACNVISLFADRKFFRLYRYAQ